MFTGLVTDVGTIAGREDRGDLRFEIKTAFDMTKVEIGASIACNGVCLTVVGKSENSFDVDVSAETCRVTTLNQWTEETLVNLEQSLKLGDELGGHIVSGHVDTVGVVESMEPVGDSLKVEFSVKSEFGHLVAEKGSIALNGVSLTVNAVDDRAGKTHFWVNIIPHTQDVTAFRTMTVGDPINVEFDMLARYVARLTERKSS